MAVLDTPGNERIPRHDCPAPYRAEHRLRRCHFSASRVHGNECVLDVRVAAEARGESAAVHGATMAVEAEAAAGLGGEWEGEMVEGARPGVEDEGLSVEVEVGVGAEEGVGEGNRGRLGHLSEQVVGIEGAAAGAVRKEEETKAVAVVMEVTGREEERVELGRGGGKEWGR